MQEDGVENDNEVRYVIFATVHHDGVENDNELCEVFVVIVFENGA